MSWLEPIEYYYYHYHYYYYYYYYYCYYYYYYRVKRLSRASELSLAIHFKKTVDS